MKESIASVDQANFTCFPTLRGISTAAAVAVLSMSPNVLWAGDLKDQGPDMNPAGYTSSDERPSLTVLKFPDIGAAELDLPWLETFYNNAGNATTAEDIYPLIEGISELFKNKDYSTVDLLLGEIELDSLSPTAMAALVRTTFPAKQKLANWNSCLERVHSKLNDLELNANRILRGLS